MSTDLAVTARWYRAGLATGEELSRAFGSAVVYCPRSQDVGFLLRGSPGDEVVAVFSSEVALAQSEGSCDWFAGYGAQLMGLVPEGCGLLVDPGLDSEVCLPAAGIKRPVATTMSG